MPPKECRLSALNERPKSETKDTKRKLLHLESNTSLRSTIVTQGLKQRFAMIFLCIPVFCAWKCERFEEKQTKQVSGGAPAPGQTMETHQKVVERHKKVVDKHYKVVDWEVKYPTAGISCVLRISTKSLQKFLNKMCRIRASNIFQPFFWPNLETWK